MDKVFKNIIITVISENYLQKSINKSELRGNCWFFMKATHNKDHIVSCDSYDGYDGHRVNYT